MSDIPDPLPMTIIFVVFVVIIITLSIVDGIYSIRRQRRFIEEYRLKHELHHNLLHNDQRTDYSPVYHSQPNN